MSNYARAKNRWNSFVLSISNVLHGKVLTEMKCQRSLTDETLGDRTASNALSAFRFELEKRREEHSELGNSNAEGLGSNKKDNKASQIRFVSDLLDPSLLFSSEKNSLIQTKSGWWIVFELRFDVFLLEKLHFPWLYDFLFIGYDQWYASETKNDQREDLSKNQVHGDRSENFYVTTGGSWRKDSPLFVADEAKEFRSIDWGYCFAHYCLNQCSMINSVFLSQ